MNYEEILKGLLSKAYKFDDGKIAEILKDGEENANETDVLNSLLNSDTERVANLKKQNADNKESFQQGYAKAKKEQREAFEKEIKDEFGFEGDTTGINLISEIISEKIKQAGKSAEGLSDDEVRKHPVFLKAEKDFKKQITDQKTDYETKLSEVENNAKKEQIFSSVKDKADAILTSLNPVFLKNKTAAANIKNQFLNELRGYEFEKQDDGTYLVLKDGKVEQDGHGHSIAFDEIVKQIAGNYYDFSENNGGSNAGNKNERGSGSGVVPRFKNEDEATAYSTNEAIPLDQRLKALEEWNASK